MQCRFKLTFSGLEYFSFPSVYSDVNACDEQGQTAVHLAAHSGSSNACKIVAVLLDEGSDVGKLKSVFCDVMGGNELPNLFLSYQFLVMLVKLKSLSAGEQRNRYGHYQPRSLKAYFAFLIGSGSIQDVQFAPSSVFVITECATYPVLSSNCPNKPTFLFFVALFWI